MTELSNLLSGIPVTNLLLVIIIIVCLIKVRGKVKHIISTAMFALMIANHLGMQDKMIEAFVYCKNYILQLLDLIM